MEAQICLSPKKWKLVMNQVDVQPDCSTKNFQNTLHVQLARNSVSDVIHPRSSCYRPVGGIRAPGVSVFVENL